MSGDFGSSLGAFFQGLLDVIGRIVSPDWGELVGLIPLAIVPVVGLFVLGALARWGVYALRRRRPRVRYVDGPTPLPRDATGAFVLPVGQPFALATGLAYPHGTTDVGGRELSVICPMCRVERPAQVRTCGNCGLELRVNRAITVARPAGPPPGGAAAA